VPRRLTTIPEAQYEEFNETEIKDGSWRRKFYEKVGYGFTVDEYLEKFRLPLIEDRMLEYELEEHKYEEPMQGFLEMIESCFNEEAQKKKTVVVVVI